MHTFSNAYNTLASSTLRNMLAYMLINVQQDNKNNESTLNLFLNTLLLTFQGLPCVRTTTYFKDATSPNLKFTSLHTLCKLSLQIWTKRAKSFLRIPLHTFKELLTKRFNLVVWHSDKTL